MQIALESLENIANLVQAEQEDAQWRETTSLLNHQNQHRAHTEKGVLNVSVLLS